MISEATLEILRCPETLQKFRLAEPAVIESLNQKIRAGLVCNKSGKKVEASLDQGLVREDHKVLYPVRKNIPTLIIQEAILL